VDMIGLDGQMDDPPVMLSRDLPDALRQPILHRPDQHLSPPPGTTWDTLGHQMMGVHDQMGAALLVLLGLLVQVDSAPQNNIACKAREPLIPWLKPRACWSFSVTHKTNETESRAPFSKALKFGVKRRLWAFANYEQAAGDPAAGAAPEHRALLVFGSI